MHPALGCELCANRSADAERMYGMAKPPAPLDKHYACLSAVRDAADRIVGRSTTGIRPNDLARLRLIWQTMHPRGYVPDRVGPNQYGNLAAFAGTMQLPTRRLAESARTRVYNACRSAASEEALAYRLAWFDSKTDPHCEVTGVPITFDTSDANYKPPHTFAAIVDAFLRALHRNVELEATLLQPATEWDGDTLSAADAKVFCAQHGALASFRVVNRAHNRNLSRRKP